MMLLPLLNTIFWVFNFLQDCCCPGRRRAYRLLTCYGAAVRLCLGYFLVATFFILKIP